MLEHVTAVRIGLLGRLVIEVDGVRPDEARLGELGRTAFAYLLLERRRPVPRDELAEVLWGDDLPRTWTSALRGVLSRVRATLASTGLAAEEVVRGERGCYQLHLPEHADVEVDVERVAATIGAALATLNSDPARTQRALAEVVDLASRRFLPGANGVWAERRQRDLAALAVRGLQLLAMAASASGDHASAVLAAREAVALAPLDESAHRGLMTAHAAAGDRAAALRAYEDCRRTLAEELGVGPSQATYALYERHLREESTEGGDGSPAGGATNLPGERTSFVGRDGQVDELAGLVEATRLLTLTGPGGVGKSRLALRVAGSLVDRYPDGVWLVELAAVADPSAVVQEVSSVVGLAEAAPPAAEEALVRHLADRAVLFVVDNCEHLVDACASLADVLLRRAARVRIVATSREPLGVPGEVTWAVPPLPAPILGPGGGADLDALLGYDAVRLFVERAATAAPTLDLRASADAVALVCARLDGIPLAIELAAARTKVLPPAEIASRLDDHLRLLVGGPRAGPGRHRTLRATIDWSFEGLSTPEQVLFARLSVFAGGCTLPAVEAVCAGPGDDVVDALEGLVDKSLVSVDRGADRSRYRMLETLRQYAAERLTQSGGTAAARNCHLAWALALAEDGADAGGEQSQRLAVLDEEHDNLRAALDWAARNGLVEEGLRLATRLARFWEIRGHLSQGRARIETFLSMSPGPPALRAKAFTALAVLAQRQGDLAAARGAYQEALVVQRARNDRLGVATALHGLANLAVNDGDLVTANALFEENLAVARQAGATRMQAASLMNLGVIAHSTFMSGARPVGEAGPDAERFYRASLAAYEELGDQYGQALALENLGALTRLFPGDHEAARALHERSLAIRRALGDRVGVADSARYIAALVIHGGDAATGRQLHEERLAIERDLGNMAHVAEALTDLGEIALVEGSHEDAARFLHEARAIYDAAADAESLVRVLVDLGELARRTGAFAESRSTLERCLRLATDLDSRHGTAWALAQLARLAHAEGDADDALALARDALALAEEYQLSGVEAVVLDLAGGVAAGEGDVATAVRLSAAAEALRRSPFRPLDREPSFDLEVARAALGPAGLLAAQESGASLSPQARRDLVRSVSVAVT